MGKGKWHLVSAALVVAFCSMAFSELRAGPCEDFIDEVLSQAGGRTYRLTFGDDNNNNVGACYGVTDTATGGWIEWRRDPANPPGIWSITANGWHNPTTATALTPTRAILAPSPTFIAPSVPPKGDSATTACSSASTRGIGAGVPRRSSTLPSSSATSAAPPVGASTSAPTTEPANPLIAGSAKLGLACHGR